VRSLVLALTLGITVAGCSSRSDTDGAAARPTSPTVETSEAPSTSLDTGPFCTNVRALEGLGEDQGDAATPDVVLAQAEETIGVLDEITATVPTDAPPDVEVLLDDFRAIVEAIVAAGGDSDAAYASLQADQPELWARLSDPAAHDGAFAFFAARCGTPLP
jgi:hypothetical protein